MTWATFINTIEEEMERQMPLDPDASVTFQVPELRTLLVRAYTEGFAEGLKRGRKQEDTHVLIKYLNRGEDG